MRPDATGLKRRAESKALSDSSNKLPHLDSQQSNRLQQSHVYSSKLLGVNDSVLRGFSSQQKAYTSETFAKLIDKPKATDRQFSFITQQKLSTRRCLPNNVNHSQSTISNVS